MGLIDRFERDLHGNEVERLVGDYVRYLLRRTYGNNLAKFIKYAYKLANKVREVLENDKKLREFVKWRLMQLPHHGQ